jgi:hypothetical protein
MLLPDEHGGLQAGPVELALVLQQAGRVLAPEPIAATALAALMLSQSTVSGQTIIFVCKV